MLSNIYHTIQVNLLELCQVFNCPSANVVNLNDMGRYHTSKSQRKPQ